MDALKQSPLRRFTRLQRGGLLGPALSVCQSDVQAEALRAYVDCVVGMSGSIGDDPARNFAIGFYGALGKRESIAVAFRQGALLSAWSGCPMPIGRSAGSAAESM